MTNHSEILRRWQLLSPYLNRRQRSLWAGAEAEAVGYGGCVLLSAVTGLSVQTIATRRALELATNKGLGLNHVQGIDAYPTGRQCMNVVFGERDRTKELRK